MGTSGHLKKMHFFRDCGVSAVLESSCITYTLRLRAVLPCTHETMTIFSRCPLVDNTQVDLTGEPAHIHPIFEVTQCECDRAAGG